MTKITIEISGPDGPSVTSVQGAHTPGQAKAKAAPRLSRQALRRGSRRGSGRRRPERRLRPIHTWRRGARRLIGRRVERGGDVLLGRRCP